MTALWLGGLVRLSRIPGTDPYNGSYDLADPQSLNRYTYVMGRPMAAVDPDGLFTNGLGDDSGDGGGLGWLLDIFNLFGLFGGGGGGHHTGPPNTADTGYGAPDDANGTVVYPPYVSQRSSDPGSLGESLGIPKSIPHGVWGIGPALGLPSTSCEFGACGGLPDGFQAQAAAPVIAAPICAIAEPCGAIVLGTAIAITGIEAGVAGYKIYQRGRTNVSDTGIVSEAQQLIAQGLAKTMCDALALLQAGTRDAKRLQRIKATQKAYGCRRSSAQS